MRTAMRLAGVLLLCLPGYLRAQPAAFQGLCTVVQPPQTGYFLDFSTSPPGQEDLSRSSRFRPATGLRTVEGNQAILHLFSGRPQAPSAEACIYLDASSQVRLGAVSEVGRRFHVMGGAVVVRYSSADGQALVIAGPGSWVRLADGFLRVSVAEGKADFALISTSGSASRFDGEPPAGDVAAVSGGANLTVRREAYDQAQILITRLHGFIGLDAPAGWLGQAERGDLIPSDPQGIGIKVDEPNVRIVQAGQGGAGITPTAASSAAVLPPITSSSITPPPQRVSGVQALLTSGNPASVVVGTRLWRARVVGGVGPPISGVRFNPLVRPPFHLQSGQ